MGMWHGSFNFKCNKRITLLGLVPINKQSLEYSGGGGHGSLSRGVCVLGTLQFAKHCLHLR